VSINHQPLVSVLMTAYNREKYIGEAIESVIVSTYPNWELIIVDDVSSDNTVAIAKKYEAIDSRIKVYTNLRNLGDYPNRNKAASYAKGVYLNYVDADDMIYPFGIQQMVYYMQQYPEAGIGICRSYNPKKMYPIVYNNSEALKEHFFNKPFLNNAPGSVIIRKEAYEFVGGFTENRHISDSLLWLRIATKYSVLKLPREMNWSRQHEDQELKYRIHKISPIMELKDLTLKTLDQKDCPLTPTEKERAIARVKKQYFRQILSRVKRLKLKKAYELYKRY